MYKEILNRYKDIDNKIIHSLENDDDKLLELFDQREEIVKCLVDLKEYKDEIKEAFMSSDLNKLDQKIKILLSEKMIEIKNKIRNTQRGQKAFNGYNASNRASNFYTKFL